MNKNKIIVFICFFIMFCFAISFILRELETYNPSHGMYLCLDPDSILYRKYLDQSILQQKVIENDKYNCFPDNFPVKHVFPPFYIRILVYSCWLFFSFFPDSNINPEFIAGALPILAYAIIYSLLLYLCWFITHDISFCLLLALFLTSNFGIQATYKFLNLDHHWLENFCIWLQIVLLIFFLTNKNMKLIIISALVNTILIGSWLGSPLYHGVMTFYSTYFWVMSKDDEVQKNLLDFISSTFIISGCIMTIYVLFITDQKYEIFKIDYFSYYHVIFPIVCGSILLLFKNLCSLNTKHKLGIITIIFSILLTILLHSYGLKYIINQAQNFLLKQNIFFRSIAELRSILYTPFVDLTNFNNLIRTFGIWILIFPLTFIKIEKIANINLLIIRDISLIFLLESIYTIRYCRWLTFGLSILSAITYYTLIKFLYSKFNKEKKVIFLILFLYMILTFDTNICLYDYMPYNFNSFILEPMIWVNKKTAKTSGYSDDKNPEYGILCYWDKGNYIAFISQRPPVASNNVWGFKTKAELYTSESEEEAYNLFKKYKLKYFFLSLDPMDEKYYLYMKALLDKNKDKTGLDVFFVSDDEIEKIRKTSKPFHESFCYWTYNNMTLIKAGSFPSAPKHFRWVYVSKDFEALKPKQKILEAVEGAIIKGKIMPNSQYKLQLEIKLHTITVYYELFGTSNDDGKIEIRVPYSTSYKGGRVKTGEYYELKTIVDQQVLVSKIKVPEEAVLNGLSIEIPEFIVEKPNLGIKPE